MCDIHKTEDDLKYGEMKVFQASQTLIQTERETKEKAERKDRLYKAGIPIEDHDKVVEMPFAMTMSGSSAPITFIPRAYDDCGIQSMDRCGGCDACLNMQRSHYDETD